MFQKGGDKMKENQSITKPNNTFDIIQSLADMEKLGRLFVESGLFPDTKDLPKAVIKILAGREIGVSPFQAMEGIDIINGRVVISPLLLSAIIKSSNKYNYRILSSSDKECTIAFYERGEFIGKSTFTIEDAKRLNLANKDNWLKQPATMLYYRALAQGIRRFAPDAYSGLRVYIEDEMGTPTMSTTSDEVIEIIPQPEEEENKPTLESPEVKEEIKAETEKVEIISKLELNKIVATARMNKMSNKEIQALLNEYGYPEIPASKYEELLSKITKTEAANENDKGSLL